MEIRIEKWFQPIILCLVLNFLFGGVTGLTNKCYSCYHAHYNPENVTLAFQQQVESAKSLMIDDRIYSNSLCATDINRMYYDEAKQSYVMYRCESYIAGGVFCAKQTVKKDEQTYFVIRRCIPECIESKSEGDGYTIETNCCNSGPYCNLATGLKQNGIRVMITTAVFASVGFVLWTLRS